MKHQAVSIPVKDIAEIEIYMNKYPRQTLGAIMKKTGADYGINGTLYDMKTFQVLCHLRKDGYVYARPNYTVYGYGWNTGEDVEEVVLPNLACSSYIACTPLIVNGQKKEKLIYNAAQGGKRGRSAIGMKTVNGERRFCLYCSKDGSGERRTPEQLRDLLYSYGWESATMLDSGGSSQAVFADGRKVITNRAVSHYLLIYLKKEKEHV